jgi:selenium metabolism protein YedF
MQKSDSVLLFTRAGIGHGPEELQAKLTVKFLSLLLESGDMPAKVLFYTDGVKLACEDSPVLEQLRQMEKQGVELVLCSTCLDYFGLREKAGVGVIGGMPDILETLQKASKVVSL